MPERCSWRKAASRATAARTSRKLLRARLLNQSVSRKSSGRIAKVASARRRSSATSTAAMPASTSTSPTIETMPAVNISLRASTSAVTRVTRRPTGVVSKYAISSRCSWAKTSRRRSAITFCPIACSR